MPIYSHKSLCKSKLGLRMQEFRADRPSEWLMDEFINDAEILTSALKSAIAFINSHAADPDLTAEMRKTYAEYENQLTRLDDLL